MGYLSRVQGHVSLALLLAIPLVAAPAQQPERGRVRRGEYTAPQGRFTVAVPRGLTVSDAHASDHGAFSLSDSYGRLDGLLYAVVPDTASTSAALRQWLDGFVMPTWFLPVAPAAKVLADSAGTFAGGPALFVLLDLPQGGAQEVVTMRDGKSERTRSDSRRVAVVFQRGTLRCVVMTETATFFGSAAKPESDWMRHAARLAEFYGGIRFGTQVP